MICEASPENLYPEFRQGRRSSLAHCGGESVSRCPANTELFCRSSGRQTGFDEFLCGGNRLRVERRATRLSVALSRRGDAIAGALGDQPPLEVRDGTEDVEHEFAGGRGGVEPLLQADQVDAAASISGAVIATGRIEVETRIQVVEHIDGGTVQEIVVSASNSVRSDALLSVAIAGYRSASTAIIAPSTARRSASGSAA